jgi:outer membrane lipoprotein-sorting protein
MFRQFRIFALSCLVLTAGDALAALSATDHADIVRAEAYLNNIVTLKARILQVSPDGSTVEGTLSLARPGHLRLDYDAPSPIMLIANRNFLIYRDKDLDNTSYIPIDSTPAGLLIRPVVKLNEDGLQVTGVGRHPGVIEITVTQSSDPKQGRITLLFSEAPFQLRQWLVLDSQGQTTSVALFDPHTDAKFDKDWFEFQDNKGSEWWANRKK